MHELEHVSLYLEERGKAASFDGLDLKESSRMEKEADEMAENALIPAELWESSAPRVNTTTMAAAAGRVRFEHNSYRLLSQLVERGEVGRLFEGV